MIATKELDRYSCIYNNRKTDRRRKRKEKKMMNEKQAKSTSYKKNIMHMHLNRQKKYLKYNWEKIMRNRKYTAKRGKREKMKGRGRFRRKVEIGYTKWTYTKGNQ